MGKWATGGLSLRVASRPRVALRVIDLVEAVWRTAHPPGTSGRTGAFSPGGGFRAVAEMVRVLRPGGLLLLADHVASSHAPLPTLQRIARWPACPSAGNTFAAAPSNWLPRPVSTSGVTTASAWESWNGSPPVNPQRHSPDRARPAAGVALTSRRR